MKRLITLLALVVSSSPAWAEPEYVVEVESFQEQLSPYGAWIELPGYGHVWQPDLEYVGDDFYPYGTSGHWVFTDEGWMFDSELPFGWAVFHYGRWLLDPDFGWVWVPGRTWAPAWVSWRMGGTYVGWAPMGPRGAPAVHRSSWLFVETGELTVINVRSRAIDERRFRSAVSITQPVHGAVPVGPPAAYVTRGSRVQITAVRVNDVRGSGRAIPPPPPPGQVRPSRRLSAPPPAQQQRERMEPSPRLLPPPPAERREQNPAFRAPPPQRMEPQRAPPPQRFEPQRAPPPQRMEPQRNPVFMQPPPAPGRMEPQRVAPAPSASPQRRQQQQQQGPPPPPGRRGNR